MAADSPLLVSNDDDAWETIETGQLKTFTMRQLIAHDPSHVVGNIKDKAVQKLGEFKVADSVILKALGDEEILTLGADTPFIDYEREWRAVIEQKAGSRKGGKDGTGWSNQVVVEAFVVNIRDAAAADEGGLVQLLLKRWQSGGVHYSVFGLPALQAVLQFKWNSFARSALIVELCIFLTWLLSFSVFSLIWQDEDSSLSLVQLLATTSGMVTVVCEVVALVAMLPFLLMEVSTGLAYGFGGWLNVWNGLDILTYVLQIVITFMHLSRLGLSMGWLSVIVAVQSVLLWFRLNYFSRVFGPTRFSFLDTLKQIVSEIRWYLFFLMLMMWGFAVSYCILFRQDQEYEQFSNVWHSLLTMFTYALGGVELDIMLNSSNPVSALVLSILYQFTMSMVLMNLLIGMMLNSLNKATEHEDLKLLLFKAQIIDELESTIPKWIERRVPKCFPPFVHVLRVDAASMESMPEGSALWRPAGAGGKDGSNAVMAELAALRKQVQALNDVLAMAVPSLPSSPSRSDM